MPVTEYFLLWKVTVPSSWIAVIAGFLLAWLAVRVKFGKLVADVVGDAFFTIIIVWKLSVIMTDFQVVIQSPASILYFNGGLFGFLAGIVVAALLFVVSRKPKPIEMTHGFLLAVIGAQSGYQLTMAMLNTSSLVVKMTTIMLFAALLLVAYLYVANETVPVLHGAGLMIAAHAFIAALQPVGFTGIPFAATVVAGVLVMIVHVFVEKGRNQMEGSHE